MGLNLLLDSADIKDWEHWNQFGIFQGITTNPTLLKQAGQRCHLSNLSILARKAEDLGYKEIHLQAWGETAKHLIKTGLEIASLKNNNLMIYVKLPVTDIGTQAAKEILSHNIPVTLTACYEIKQTLIAASLGANYIAPYIGRMNKKNNKGEVDVISMQKTLSGLNSSTKLLVASIKNVNEIINLSTNKINTFTINSQIAHDLFNAKDTIFDAKRFAEDSNF